MKLKLNAILSSLILVGATGVNSAEVDWDRLLNAHKDKKNWMMYHQDFNSHHHSKLTQINTKNVKDLSVAFIHTPDATKRGIQSFPLAVDGVLYYTSASGKVWAIDGTNGKVIWSYKAKLDMERGEGTIYNPYNRGVAVAYGKVYMGTIDGRIIAIDRKTGKLVFDKMVMTTEKGNKGFTGAPLIVKDKVLVGATGGEMSGCCGPLYAVNAQTGETEWQFDVIGGDQRSRDSWGNDSWKTGGGSMWQTGNYDPKTDTIWWGTGNPAPDYDHGGDNWMTDGARPGTNLYTSSVVALDPDTGKLKGYFQEVPHDFWDFDSAVGEFMRISRDGKDYMVHPNKGGFIVVYDSKNVGGGNQLNVENAYVIGETLNFISGVSNKGELLGRVNLKEGSYPNLCPAIDGAISWNTGAYSPKTGLMYKIAQEWCHDLEVVKAEAPEDFSGQLYLGASWTTTHPKGKKAYGTVQARDPITGKMAWRVEFKYPPLASLLSTEGDLVFVPGADGIFSALDAKTGKELWSHNNGLGHHGGVISYEAKGKQYIAVVTGWGSHLAGNYGPLFGHPFDTMPTDNGQLIVFAVK